jgi:hypothetical protein
MVESVKTNVEYPLFERRIALISHCPLYRSKNGTCRAAAKVSQGVPHPWGQTLILLVSAGSRPSKNQDLTTEDPVQTKTPAHSEECAGASVNCLLPID